jgi:hypothetical protein
MRRLRGPGVHTRLDTSAWAHNSERATAPAQHPLSHMSSVLRCTQHIDGTITTGYDGKRALRMMFWGGAQHGQLASVLAHMRTAAGCIFGPFAHSWFTFIDRRELVFVRFGSTAMHNVLLKTFLDQARIQHERMR